jgi:hypothetical protein
VSFGYAIAENDVLQHEVEASGSFDDWYEALTEMRDPTSSAPTPAPPRTCDPPAWRRGEDRHRHAGTHSL